MRKIIKGKEPGVWVERRQTPGFGYESIPALRDSLLKEQGYICAYCMRRITAKGNDSNEDCRIDHIRCRNKYPELELDYKNMVICCPGAITPDYHCDKSKEAKDITFDLFSDSLFETLRYSSSGGQISSSNETWNREMNDILNLNNRLLKQNRKQALDGAINIMGRQQWKKRDIKLHLDKWGTKNQGQYKPYCGIVIWFLKKKLA